MVVWAFCCSGVTFTFSKHLPIVGLGIRALQNIYVPESRDKTVRARSMVDAIKERCANQRLATWALCCVLLNALCCVLLDALCMLWVAGGEAPAVCTAPFPLSLGCSPPHTRLSPPPHWHWRPHPMYYVYYKVHCPPTVTQSSVLVCHRSVRRTWWISLRCCLSPPCCRASDRRMPMLSVAPEGTLSHGRCLLSFKTGAFVAGVPVVPILLRYKQKPHNPAWTIITMWWHLLRMLCQFKNDVTGACRGAV